MRIENRLNRVYSFDEKAPLYKSENSRVYYATDEVFGRRVCLKILSLLNNNESFLKKEILALSKAGTVSNRVPQIFDFWTDRNKKEFYIVMQLISGDSLRKKMAVCDRNYFNDYMISVCDTLSKIHGAHIYHKDIKPENIVIAPNGDPFLIDFNISIGKSNLSQGTEFYRAPEMYQAGLSVERGRADIFSLGVIMYEYYTGKLPLDGVHYIKDFFSEAGSDWGEFSPPDKIAVGMPLKLSEIITKCMSRNPEKRYRSADELKRELKNISKEIRGWKNQM